MSIITKNNRRVFFAVMATSFLQMAMWGLAPAIAKIQSEVFTDRTLAEVQTALTLPNLLSMVFAVSSAFLIGRGWMSKKTSVVIGVSIVALTGLVAVFLHQQFWHLIMLSVLLGTGMGFYISTTASIMFDNFNSDENRLAVGLQTSVINLGGIVVSIFGGLLTTLVWYGGFLMLFIAVPVVVISIWMLPNDRKRNAAAAARGEHPVKTKFPLDVIYYGLIVFVFSLVFNVCGTNISTHLQQAGIGNSATAGIATAIQMGGGVLAGFAFRRISAKLKDYTIAAGFVIIFVGLMTLAFGQQSLIVNFIGVFITGTAISLMIPQCLFSVAGCVNRSNSASATAIANCIMPGLGGFLSPVVFTNLTIAIGGESTSFRYGFVAVVSLIAAAVVAGLTARRAKRFKPFEPVIITD